MINNSPIQDYVHPDDHTQPTNEMTPGFKPFTRLGMPHRPRNAFRPSLALFSVCLMLHAPVASSEKKTIFGRRVYMSSIQTTCPIHRSCAFMISSLMPRMSALRSTSVLETFSSQEIAHDLAKASEVKLIECFLLHAFFRAFKSHSHRAGNDNNCLVNLTFGAYCSNSLSPYPCPQPAEGNTCLSQSVEHFLIFGF